MSDERKNINKCMKMFRNTSVMEKSQNDMGMKLFKIIWQKNTDVLGQTFGLACSELSRIRWQGYFFMAF